MTATPTPSPPPPEQLFERAARFSRFLRRLRGNPPSCFQPQHVHEPLQAGDIAGLLAGYPVADEAGLHHALREVRKAAMLRIITRDLGGLADLDEVLASTSALAEETLRFALRHLDQWAAAAHGEPSAESDGSRQRLLVMGMGNLGGH